MANIKKYQRGGMSRAYPKNFNPVDLFDIPQKELMNILFNERKRPSEIMSGDELGSQLMGKDNYGLLADLLLDPLNAVPLSLVKYLRGLKGTKKIPLSIAQKVGNTLWAGDKINDINAINQSEVVYPYLSSLLNNNNNMKKQFGGSTKPLHTLQFGGLSNMPMFDVFNNMNNSWMSFWREGDYFNLGTQGPYNYDPLNPTVNQPIGRSKLMTTVDNNRAILDSYTSNKNAVDKAYKGDWGADAHDYYYNQSLGNTYSANQLESFVAYDRGKDSAAWKSVFGDLPQAGVPEGYNTWKAGRDAYADVAGAQYNADRQNIANQPLYNKALGSAFNNTASGIFSGLNYMNSYVPPEKINTSRGFQGVQYAQNGLPIKPGIIPYVPDEMKVVGDLNRQQYAEYITNGADFTDPARMKYINSMLGNLYPDQYGYAINSSPTTATTPVTTKSTKVATTKPKGASQTAIDPNTGGLSVKGDTWQYRKNSAGEWEAYDTSRPEKGWMKANGKALTSIENNIAPIYTKIQTGKVTPKVPATIAPNLIDYSTFNPETESRIGGLFNMTPGEAAKWDNSFNISGPSATRGSGKIIKKQIESIVKDNENKIATLEKTVESLKPSSSNSTNFDSARYNAAMAELENLKAQTKKLTSKRQPWKNLQFLGKSVHPKGQAMINALGLYQMGGDTSQMGYTPGYPSMNNPYNKIPGDTITTQQTPINLLGIGSTGEIKIMKANNEEPYKFWGSKHVTEIPSLQFGGSVKNPNNFFTNVIVPSMMDGKVEHLQTEKGEVVFLPDGSLAETKATKKHKDMKKNEVTDILPEGYVFSNDPKMKFSVKSSIGGVKLGDMNLGKSAFEYKENEVTEGPKDIMLSDMFFGNSKKELTTAEIAKNIKKNLPLVDMKGDWFADTANEENKEQRIEYFTILKSFNEFKKPKKNKIQHAQYGAQTAPKDYLKSGIDFMNNVGNPFVNMDNTLVSKFMNNQGTYGQLPAYQYGGDINHAPLGMMIGAAAAPLLGSLFGHIAGNSARRKQNRQNAQDLIRFNTYQDNLRQGIEKGVLADNVTNLATYAASLNVPLDKYDDMSRQTSMAQESFRKQKLMLESSRRNAGTYSGTGTSMARFMNPANMGSYLANLDNASKSAADQLTNQLATLEANRNTAITGLLTQSTANRNNALNKRDTQLYNANVAGIGNVGKSVSTGQMTMSNLNYELGLEGLTFEDQLRQRAQAAYDRSSNKVQGIFNTAGAGLGAVGNYMDMAKAGANSMTNATRSLTASMPQAVEQAAIENRNKVLQQNIISSGLRPQINPIPQLTYNPQTPFLPPLSSYPTNTIGYGAMDNGIWGATMQPINRIPLNPMYVPDPKSIIMQTPNNGQYTGYNFLGPQVQY